MAELPEYPGAPRWVKRSGLVIGVLVVLALLGMHLRGGIPHHGILAGGSSGSHAATSGANAPGSADKTAPAAAARSGR